MVRKVFKSGNSLVVTLPPEVRELGIAEDTEVDVVIHEGKVVIGLRSSSAPSAELLEWSDAFIERHRELLERLA
jgi:antitoxin component of MazEF toxin-antitoxin module